MTRRKHATKGNERVHEMLSARGGRWGLVVQLNAELGEELAGG